MKTTTRSSAFFFSALGLIVGFIAATRLDRWLPSAAAADSDFVRARGFELVDDRGRRQALIALGGEGTPGLWLFDKNGKARLNLGLYEDGNPTVVLNDPQERAVEIVRTTGAGVPVLVMKSDGRDRVVMGLDGQEEPFLTTWDRSARAKTIFGAR